MEDTTLLMVVKNIEESDFFPSVVKQASKFVDQAIIVDNGSSDDTKKCVENLRDEVIIDIEYEFDDSPYYNKLKHDYVARVETPYTLLLDDDEVLESAAIDDLYRAVKEGKTYCFLGWWTYFLQEAVEKSEKLVLFKTSENPLTGEKHPHNLYDEKKILSVSGDNVMYADTHINHHSYPSVSDLVQKGDHYGKRRAENLYKDEPYLSKTKLCFKYFIRGVSTLLYLLTVKKMITSQTRFLYALNSMVVRYYTVLYYIELQNK
jgi:GT2 family glycosyltransferase